MSAWATMDNRQRTFWIVVATVGVVSIAYALDIRYLILGQRGVTAIDDIGEAVAAAIAAAACAWAATRASGRVRLGWALMGISTGLWAAGEVVWSIYEVGLNVPTWASSRPFLLPSVAYGHSGVPRVGRLRTGASGSTESSSPSL
ncbi:MAG: hypothetical protein E6I13_13205 [Chloroflexi bacterium]|nr:MAG: hypothetical protein E6I13_13205 [Chloroflexota bacterium]